MKFYLLSVGVIILFVIVGCDNSTGIKTCTAEAEPAIVVEVINAKTGEFIAKDVKGVIIDGSYQDSLRHANITQTVPTLIVRSLAAGAERAGTYDINLQLEGFTPWSREGIKVLKESCGPQTIRLQARLRAID